NFWILSNVLLVVIIRLYSHVLNESSARQVPENFNTTWIIAILLDITYGTGLGLSGYYLERNIFKKLSLGKILLYKTFVSLVVLILMFAIFRFVLFDLFIAPSLMKEAFKLNANAWDFLFYLLLIYYFFMSMVISFINQVN